MLVFKEEALEEIRQAHLWYEVQRAGLGVRFREDLRAGLRFVEDNMPGYRLRSGPYRALLLERFPYLVWYAIEGGDIVVYRVRHVKQRPLKRI